MTTNKLEDALAHFQRGDYAGAQRLCKQILRRESSNAKALHLLGAALLSAGDPAESVMALKRAALYAPTDAEIYLLLANALAAEDRVAEAIDTLSNLLSKWPKHSDALYNRAVLLQRLRRFEEASDAYAVVLRVDPRHAAAYNNQGVVLESLGRYDEAESCYRAALARHPNSVHALSNLGKVLRTQGKLEAAAQACTHALEIQPDFTDALVNLAGVLGEQAQYVDAQARYRQALQWAPQDAEAHTSYGMLCLGLGQFELGWQHYQWRAQRKQARTSGVAVDTLLPVDIAGKRVLLIGEQGLGDELFFLRYAPMLKTSGGRLLAFCDGKIAELLRRTGLFEAVHTHGTALPERDHCYLMGDLPWVMGNAGADASRWNAQPAPLTLSALPARVEAMRARLAGMGPAPYFGLTWRAGTPPQEQQGRVDRALYKNAPMAELGAVLRAVPGTWLALQRQPRASEIESISAGLGRPVHDLSAANEDLEDMLALLTLLQGYIGVSNTNMHLLAGLGGRAHVLVPNPPDWRWMTAGEMSPWFPGFKVYRQAVGGDWQAPLRALAMDLT